MSWWSSLNIAANGLGLGDDVAAIAFRQAGTEAG